MNMLGTMLRDFLVERLPELLVKIVAAAMTVLWGHLTSIAPVLWLYVLLVIGDVDLGYRIAKKKGVKMDRTMWLTGPASKIRSTAILFIGASIIDSMIPGQMVLYGVSGFVCVAMYLDVSAKTQELTGYKVFGFIKNKLKQYLSR